eukprot:CAMPEP_0114517266 /NCGR_PEP_ID=MMETSP0109-20121206/17797_1 /TAXON_ID=29199 /ORGANISM="Chlorarachnion reptans, Strain CCCM449" /LENGTH=495 /DNA_ID=CAMNT_0001697765 /DNA_START=38 /DNA_END=1525 /DNA_ORIENTATION=+
MPGESLVGASSYRPNSPTISYGPPRGVFLLLLATTFAMGVEYAILMPTVWKYVQSVGGSKAYLGILLAGFSATRTIAFVFVGWWSDRRAMREPFMFSFFIGAIGNLLYGLAGGLNSFPVMMLGRLVAGVGAASTTLNQSYIARASSSDQRTRLMSLTRGCSILGIAAGPVMNLLLLRLDDEKICTGRFCLNSMTSAGYVMVVVNLLLCLLFAMFFVEPPPQMSSYSRSLSYSAPAVGSADGGIQETKYSEIGVENDEGAVFDELTGWEAVKIVILERAGWFCLLVNFVTGFQMTALETALTPITADQYGWGAQENSYLFAGITGIALVAIISSIVFDKMSCCSPRGIILVAQVSLGVSFAMALSMNGGAKIPLVGLLVFAVFLIYGIVLQGPPAMGIYSIMIGDFNKGVFMGYSQIVLGVARIFGPLFAGITLEFHTHWFLFAVLAGVYAITPISFPFVWKKIVNEPKEEALLEGGSMDEAMLHNPLMDDEEDGQ